MKSLVQAAKQAIRQLPGGLMVKQLDKDDALKQGGAFAALAGWSLIQASAGTSDLQGPCWIIAASVCDLIG